MAAEERQRAEAARHGREVQALHEDLDARHRAALEKLQRGAAERENEMAGRALEGQKRAEAEAARWAAEARELRADVERMRPGAREPWQARLEQAEARAADAEAKAEAMENRLEALQSANEGLEKAMSGLAREDPPHGQRRPEARAGAAGLAHQLAQAKLAQAELQRKARRTSRPAPSALA
eukprot:tig00020610_g12038.t1